MFDIGTLGGSNSVAWDVNASGQIVGRSWTGSVGHAFLYDNGTMTDLGSLAGPSYESIAHAINDDGDIVGSAIALNAEMLQSFHAFLYRDGVMTDLGTMGAYSSEAFDVNDNGDVVGFVNGLPGNVVHAFHYSGGVMTDLGSLQGAPPTSISMAYAINNSGVIVGRAMNSSGVYRPFVYSGGVMSDLGTLGGSTAEAKDINDAGQIVGESVTAGGQTRAFLYEGGVMTDLGTLGGNNSWATGIDSLGNVVGYSNTVAGPVHAFLWDGSVMHDLGHLGMDISLAHAIGEGGRVVGYAYTMDGLEHGFAYDLCSHDGILDVFEQCDDGNDFGGDGCSSQCRVELCHSCSGEPSVCSADPAGSSCDDGIFCNGVDTCSAAGLCEHAGDPCPGTECGTCSEVDDECFSPFGAACTLPGVCGVTVCSGSGTCGIESLCEGPFGALSCSDGSDNDGDMLVDAGDPHCAPLHEGPPTDATCTNGIDDDEDGDVDAADRGCLPDPPEVCNGFDDDSDGSTDEGFPDFDGDGLADCIDQDEDNDDVADSADNCPLAANAAQTDSDLDGSGDACDANVPDVINVPSSVYMTVDGQFEPAAGEWADVTPVSYMDGEALVYTSLDPGLDTIFMLFDFSLGTERLEIGDEVGPITFHLGNDTVVDLFVRQGGADSDATAHPVSSSGGVGDSVRMLLNGNPFDATSGCITGAVDFNTTSPSFAAGHNVVELSVKLAGHPGGCYAPGPSFWSVTLPGVQPGGLRQRSTRASHSSTSFLVSQSYVEVDPGSGVTTLAPIGADSGPTDAFKCYTGVDLKDPRFAAQVLALEDEFETKTTLVRKPVGVCVPTMDDDPLLDATTSLGCYKIKDAKDQEKFPGRRVQVSNAYGTLQLEARKAAQLCTPVALDGESSDFSLESFKCYRTKDLKNPAFTPAELSLSNRFGASTTELLRPAILCNPVSVDGSDIVNADTHLACYKIDDVTAFSGAEVSTLPGFGPLRLELKKSSLFCAPSAVSLLP